MSDPHTAPAGAPVPTPPAESRWRRFRRSGWTLLGVAILTGFIGYGAGRISSARSFFAMHHSSDTAIRRAEWGINRVLSRVDGTMEQKAKVAEIARAAIRDLQPMRHTLFASRDKLATLLKAEKLDRAAIEQLRADQLALGEAASKRATQAIADAADVLTPWQRAALVERWQRRSWRG